MNRQLILILLILAAVSRVSLAADVGSGWSDWGLPPNRSVHGSAIDSLFQWIFWITVTIAIGVEIALVAFAIVYRQRDGRRARFTHGNLRVETAWTITPAIIFMLLAMVSKRVWENYRATPATFSDDTRPATVLVIGQQFQWNYIYPGPDGKLGRYLVYPKPTDLAWQNPESGGKPFRFRGANGPAELPPTQARTAIDDYIATINPLGKDFDDPAGADDNWSKLPGRTLTLPRGRRIIVRLASKDVIHDFFLPNFRVKLDAVPGLLGRLDFQMPDNLPTSSERESTSRRSYSCDELEATLKSIANRRLTIAIGADDKSKGATFDARARQWLFKDTTGTIIRDGQPLRDPVDPMKKIERLRAIGVQQVAAYMPGDWDLVCEQLCGSGHTTMQGTVRFVTNGEYDALKLDVPAR